MKNRFNLKQKFAWFSDWAKGCSQQRCLRHTYFTTPDTVSYDYKYTSFNVIQDQEAYKKQTVLYCKGKNMKRVQFITYI